MKKKKRVVSRRSPNQSRSQETVEAILQATAQILIRDGLGSCSTNHIAERAGVSIGTLYQYFDDKSAVFQTLFEREIEKDSTAIEAIIAQLANQEIETEIPRLIDVTLKRLSDQPRLRQVLMAEYASSKRLKDIKRHLASLLTTYLTAHPQFRIARNIELEILIVVNAVEAAIYAAIFEYGTRLDRAFLIREVSDLVLRYLSKYRA